MKKFLVLFVCLAAFAAGSTFALDLPDAVKIPGLTVTGDVRTGLRVEGGTHKDADDETDFDNPSAFGYSDDLDNGAPFRAQLVLLWERENLGVKTRFRYQPSENGGDLGGNLAGLNNTVNKAFVYAKLFDDKTRVSVGKGVDGAWTLPWSNFGTNTSFDDADGVKLEIKPIVGLNIGAFYGTNNLFAKANTPGSTVLDPITDQPNDFRRFVVGAKYSSDIITVMAALGANVRELNNSNFSEYKGDLAFRDAVNEPFYGTSNVLLGASITPSAIPLTVNFAGLITGIGTKTVAKAYKDLTDTDYAEGTNYKDGKFNPFWMFRPKLNVEFGVNDAVAVGVNIYDLYFADGVYNAKSGADEVKDSGLGLLFPITFNPYITFAVNEDATVGVDVLLKVNTEGSDVFGVGFKPSAEFSLGSGAKFVVYDEIIFYGNSKAYGKDADQDFVKEHYRAGYIALNGTDPDNPSPIANTTANTLQFDFVWTF